MRNEYASADFAEKTKSFILKTKKEFMSVKLRFKRVGMPKQPHYRLVAIDSRRARNGKELEVLGHYHPRSKENAFSVVAERVQYWLSCGAKPSDTVKSLLTRQGIISKNNPAQSKAAPQPSQESSEKQ